MRCGEDLYVGVHTVGCAALQMYVNRLQAEPRTVDIIYHLHLQLAVSLYVVCVYVVLSNVYSHILLPSLQLLRVVYSSCKAQAGMYEPLLEVAAQQLEY